MAKMTVAQRRIHDAALRLFASKGSADISVSELAATAGVARGTIYNNLASPEHLFEQVAAQLADEMDERIVASYTGIDDPALRLAVGVRLYIRRAHEEPHWGRFLAHFGVTSEALRKVWSGPPVQDLVLGLSTRRYDFREDQTIGALGLLGGTTLSGIMLVLEGLRTWRDAGSDAAELILKALGIDPAEARQLATTELPALAELP